MSQDKEREALIARLSNVAETLHEMPMETAELCALLREVVAALATQPPAVQGEPFGYVTVRRLSQRHPNHVDQYQFYKVAPYVDNVDECHAVYTASPPSREVDPLTEWGVRGMLARLKCWHRLTEDEAADLVEFARRHGVGR